MEEIFPAQFCIPILPGHFLQRHSWYKAGGPKGKSLGAREAKADVQRSQVGTSGGPCGYVLEAQVSLRPWEGGGWSFQGAIGFWLPQGSCPHFQVWGGEQPGPHVF